MELGADVMMIKRSLDSLMTAEQLSTVIEKIIINETDVTVTVWHSIAQIIHLLLGYQRVCQAGVKMILQ